MHGSVRGNSEFSDQNPPSPTTQSLDNEANRTLKAHRRLLLGDRKDIYE